MAERVRVEIGFESGAVLAAAVSTEAADALEQALGSGQEGTFVVDVEDGRTTVVLHRVVYVKRFAREARVGFGA